MRLTARQENLLLTAIGEYIETGTPVASEELRLRHRLSASPATIRNELLSLSEEGFLVQPHTSAGRIPTDRGYRWYANKVKEHPSLRQEEERLLESLMGEATDISSFFRSCAEIFAEIAETLVVAGEANNPTEPLHKSGFREILALPEFTDAGLRDSFGELVDSIDEEVRKLAEETDLHEPRVFVGSENPITEFSGYSMIVRTIDRKKVTGVIAIIGPTRMQYDKGFSLLREIERFFE
ncbi:MAG: hypothetical protein HY471_03255 [Candidatus Sungbacteria bacterium]|nr:hypothetical protein [Candidatus Sungbacteria bacterium]